MHDYIPSKRSYFRARAKQASSLDEIRTTHYDDEDNLLYQTTSVVVERFSSGDSFIVGYRKLLLPNGTLSKLSDNIPIHIADIELMTKATEDKMNKSYKLPCRSAQIEEEIEIKSPRGTDEDTMKNSCPGDYSNQPLGLHKRNQIGVDCEKITGLKRGGFEDERSVLPKKSKSTASSTSDPTGKCTGSRCPGSSDQTSKEEDVQEQSNMRMRERRRRFPVVRFGSQTAHNVESFMFNNSISNPYIGFVSQAVVQDLITDDNHEHQHDCQNNSVDVFVYNIGEICIQESSVFNIDFQSAYGDSLASYLLAFQSGPQQPDPDSHAAAMRAYDAQGWKDAEQQEIDSLTRLQVLSKPLCLPDGARVVKTKWVYKRKRNADGTVERLRARLVAKGFSQVFGEDYFDTYAPVARLTTLRLVYAMTVVMDLSLAGMDVDAAFLNADLQEDLYIKAPVGTKPLPQGHVYKLLKALYGLKQSPKEWNVMLNDFLINTCEFTRLTTEHCLYINKSDIGYIIIAVYVDDLIVAYSNDILLTSFKDKLTYTFKIRDLGTLTRALNMELTRTPDGGLFVS